MRPIDQGFQEALVLKGGGIGQPSDLPGGSSYFDPVLLHNGRVESRTGYCSDIFTGAAIDYIRAHRRDPFFVYLAFNCPHTPLQVPDSYVAPYRAPKPAGQAQPPSIGEVAAKVYGMVANIDENLDRLLKELDALDLAENTIVIFLTDNGPQQDRYNAGLRGRKSTVYDGGTRVPCFVRWPNHLTPRTAVDRIAAHIDIAPTLLDACGVPKPKGVAFDGVSLWPLLTSRVDARDWSDRTLFIQYHRGDVPEKFRAFFARRQRFKLVHADPRPGEPAPQFELFDMEDDPYERINRAADFPEVVDRLRSEYSRWFDDVSRTRGFDPPRIHLGSPRENPTTLTRQDWRSPSAGWTRESLGHWEVEVVRPGTYDLMIRYPEAAAAGTARVSLRGVTREAPVGADAGTRAFEGLELTPGPGRLDVAIQRGELTAGPTVVEVRRRD
jgi:hypothetical protein